MLSPPVANLQPSAAPVLQRKCDCGERASKGGDACEACETEEPLRLQPKLKIGVADDPLEREADRIADSVLSAGRPDFSRIPATLQRSGGTAAPAAGVAPPSVHRALAEPGRPLDPSVRREMEAGFGRDFSKVRIHDGAAAGQSVRDVDALAYAVGEDIVFRPGRYAPTTASGRRLLAHELAHVVQQGNDEPGVLRRGGDGNTDICGGWSCQGSPCAKPDPGREGSGATPTSWALKVMIDLEATSPATISSGRIGHTYVEFLDSTGKAYTYGFYPASQTIPFIRPRVAGCVVHPDNTHAACVDYVKQFTLAAADFQNALTFAQQACTSPESYHIFDNNCSTFAHMVALHANQALPDTRGKIGKNGVEADNPNTLYEGLRKEQMGSAYEPTPDTADLEGDTNIREWVAKAPPAQVAAILPSESIRMVKRLLAGWVSDEDLDAIAAIMASQSASSKRRIREAVRPLGSSLWSKRQQDRFYGILK